MITGITFQNWTSRGANLYGTSSYNEISYNSWINDSSHDGADFALVVGGITGTNAATNNWIHHNYFSRRRNGGDPCGEAVDMVRIGMSEQGPSSIDNYNTFENNYVEWAGHATLMTNSKYNVVKNNIVHNEPWIVASGGTCATAVNLATYDNAAYNGKYGHRNFSTCNSDPNNKCFELIEGNRIGFASPNPNNGGSTNLDMESPGSIARYNFIYGGFDSGIYFKYAQQFPPNPSGGVLNHVYNNTIYANGKGWNAGVYGTGNLSYNGEGIAQFSGNGTNTNNVIVNNLIYGNGYSGQWDICYLGWYPGSNCSASSLDTVANNWLTSNGDPKFTNPDLTNPLSQNLFSAVHGYMTTPIPDLTLQASSPAIDRGTWLTTATNSGNGSSSLTVADASFFQDGTWGSSLTHGVTLFPDWIAIGTVTNTVQVSSVSYSTNAITLASPMTWTSGAHIWLYKKSDGAVVLAGAAPDYGASEYGTGSTTPPPPAPTNLLATIQ